MSVGSIALPRRERHPVAVARARSWRDDWVPVAVFLAVAVVLFGAALAAGQNPLASGTWAHWDSGLYESIARHGYRIDPCLTPGVDGVCGNAGWFPGYPVLLAGLLGLGVPLPAGGVLLSWAFSLATLVLLWRTFLPRRATPGAIACLVFAACPPGAVYHYAEFPLAMNAFLTVLALWQLHRRRWLAAGVVGAVACASYVIGVVLAPVVLVWAACQGHDTPWRERLRRAALSGGVMSLGPIAVVTAMWLSTGHWNAYFMVQAKYNHHLVWPGVTFSQRLDPLLHGSGLERVPPLQMILVAVMMAALIVHGLRRARALGATRWLILSVCAVLWLFPLTQNAAPLWRSASVLVPAALLVRHVRARWAVPLLVALVALAFPVTMLFVEGRLS